MSSAALKQLKDKALELSEMERAELAHDLLISLDGPADPGASEAWAAEIQRRVDEIDSAAVELVGADEVCSRIQERLRGRQ